MIGIFMFRQTCLTIYRSALDWMKRQFAYMAAIITSRLIHLSRAEDLPAAKYNVTHQKYSCRKIVYYL